LIILVMENLWKKIVDHRGHPLSWPALIVLAIASLLYRLGWWLGSLKKGGRVRLTTPVVSIGNLTVGGTGKTPVTLEIARILRDEKVTVGVVVSGYKRKIKDTIIATGTEIVHLDPDRTGDELMLLAASLPEAVFAVAGSKTEAAILLERKYHPDIILIDDGYQHRRLFRDLDILLVDAARDLLADYLLPLGYLREPLGALSRADMILVTRANYSDRKDRLIAKLNELTAVPIIPVEFINREIVSDKEKVDLDRLGAQTLYLFGGIGHFGTLEKHLADRGLQIVGGRAFPDHCRYDARQRRNIETDLAEYCPDYAVTTLKDYVKLKTFDFGRPLYYLNLALEFDRQRGILKNRLIQVPGNRHGTEI